MARLLLGRSIDASFVSGRSSEGDSKIGTNGSKLVAMRDWPDPTFRCELCVLD